VKTRLALFLPPLLASIAAAEPLTLESHTVRDSMAVNKDAVTFLKPKGWKVSGGIQWYLEASHQACLEVKVANPDGLEQIEALPWCYGSWFTRPIFPMAKGSNYMGNIVMQPIEHPRDVVEQLTLPNLRAKYRPKIVGYLDMPEVAKAHSQELGGAKVKAGRIRVEYAIGGKMVEEDFYLSIFVTSFNLGVNDCVSYIWGPAAPPFSLRAEKGKLDAATPLMLASANSAKLNPKWYAEYMYVCDLFQQRMANGIKNAKALSDTITRNGDEIFKMYSESYWSRQKSQDHIHQQFSDYIRGVQRYDSPYEKYPVQLPNTHKYAWAGANGSYILTDDSTYNPNVGGTGTWKLLKPAR
jgi:hypothetical protein